jgi:hypothetical protein
MPGDWLHYGARDCWHKPFCEARRVAIDTIRSWNGSARMQRLAWPSTPIWPPFTPSRYHAATTLPAARSGRCGRCSPLQSRRAKSASSGRICCKNCRCEVLPTWISGAASMCRHVTPCFAHIRVRWRDGSGSAMMHDMRSGESGSHSVAARLRSGFAQAAICKPEAGAQLFVLNTARFRRSSLAPGTACRFNRHAAWTRPRASK